MRGQFKIETITAFIAVDDDGTEGVVGTMTPMGMMPMIAADEDRLKSLEPKAQVIATETKKTITLARFSVRTDLRQIEPNRLEPTHKVVRSPGGSEFIITNEEKNARESEAIGKEMWKKFDGNGRERDKP